MGVLLTRPDKQNRLPSLVAHGQRGAHLGQTTNMRLGRDGVITRSRDKTTATPNTSCIRILYSVTFDGACTCCLAENVFANHEKTKTGVGVKATLFHAKKKNIVKYLRVDRVEFGENHTVNLMEPTRRGIVRQRLGHPSKETSAGSIRGIVLSETLLRGKGRQSRYTRLWELPFIYWNGGPDEDINVWSTK